MNDRTSKVLLLAIAIALWGLLLRPLATPLPVQAQGEQRGQPGCPSVVVTDENEGALHVVANGKVHSFVVRSSAASPTKTQALK